MVGGQQKRVRKIMKFKKAWIENNYINPLRAIERGETSRPALPSPPRPRPPPPRRNNDSCTIL
jgi:hypothetical protein